MILQALHRYYQRKAEDAESGIAPYGFEWKEIPFIVVVDKHGKFVDLEDTRETEGKKKIAKRFLAPQSVKRTAGVSANLLWDNSGYVLGEDKKSKPERAKAQKKAFLARIIEVGTRTKDKGVEAVAQFLESGDSKLLRKHSLWKEVVETGGNISFRLKGQTDLVCQCSAIQRYTGEGAVDETAPQHLCLVTGEQDEIESLHPPIKGVVGAQTSGANIVSFNLEAFRSYGKSQGENAPVGKRAAFSYTTALNQLLSKESRQKLRVGESTLVFWAEKADRMESLLTQLFDKPPEDNPEGNVEAIRSLYSSPKTGALPFENDTTRFFVLALSPNAARIAVRFWHVCTVQELAGNIRQHFDDIRIAHAPFEPEYLSLFRLLVSTAVLNKAENISPNMGGEVMKCILNGARYPVALLQAAVRRNRAEREVPYSRAALIKAWINRDIRSSGQKEKEITMALDDANTNVGYRLGRLFAVLERAQEEANPDLNATIRDRFYGAASSTPVTVFPNLMRLKNHHIAKLESRGRAVNLEKLIGNIMDGVGDFPSFLPLADQGRFAIGYYHQRQNFFAKSTGN
jgi:CRISPR-associated protein Csd1